MYCCAASERPWETICLIVFSPSTSRFFVARSHPWCRSAPAPLPHQPRANQVQRVGYSGAGKVRRASGRILVSDGEVPTAFFWSVSRTSTPEASGHLFAYSVFVDLFTENFGTVIFSFATAVEFFLRGVLYGLCASQA